MLHAILDIFKSSDDWLIIEATGVLWGLVEYPECQVMAIESGVFDSMIQFIASSVQVRQEEGVWENATKYLADEDLVRFLGCLHCLSTNDACRPRMMPCVDVLLTLFGARAAVMVRYFCVHTLASLLEDSRFALPKQDQIVAKIREFLETILLSSVVAVEEESQYVWVSLRPFTDLLSAKHAATYALGMFSLANLTSREANRGYLRTQELEQLVVAHALWPRSTQALVVSYAEKIRENLQINEAPPLKVIAQHSTLPRLSDPLS